MNDAAAAAAAAEVLEFSGAENDVAAFGQPVEFECADKTFRCEDLMIHAEKSVFVPVSLVREPIRTAVPAIPFVDRHPQIIRADPLYVQIRIGVCLEYQLAWGVEFTNDEEFLFAGLGGHGGFVCHIHFSELFYSNGSKGAFSKSTFIDSKSLSRR